MDFDKFWEAISTRNGWKDGQSAGELSVDSVKSLARQAWDFGKKDGNQNSGKSTDPSSIFDNVFGARGF